MTRAKCLSIKSKAVYVTMFVPQEEHFCKKCSYSLSEGQYKVFDSLPQLEETLTCDVKLTLVYIVGYITIKHQSNGNDTFNSLADSLLIWTEVV